MNRSGGGASHVSLAISSRCAAAAVSYCGQRGKETGAPWQAVAHSACMKRGLRAHSPAAAHARHAGLLSGATCGGGWPASSPAPSCPAPRMKRPSALVPLAPLKPLSLSAPPPPLRAWSG